MTTYFWPGCTMMLYDKSLVEKIRRCLAAQFGDVDVIDGCCQHDRDWSFAKGSRLVNLCPGCHQRLLTLLPPCETMTFYQLLADGMPFDYPDYGGRVMTIHDACSTRHLPVVMDAVRTLCGRMHIALIEPEQTRERGMCCGDSVYNKVPLADYTAFAQRRCEQLPCEEAVVYCVSCVKSVGHGGRTPRHIASLLFGVDSPVGEADPVRWHEAIGAYKAALLSTR